MSILAMSTTELRALLLSRHGETAPKGWTKTQLRLRMVELEGEEVMTPAKKQITPLKELERKINKAAHRKAELQELMRDTMGMNVILSDTVDQLKIKALNHAYMITQGDPRDYVGFGQFAHLTYQELVAQEKSYVKWVLEECRKGEVSPKLRRLGQWLILPQAELPPLPVPKSRGQNKGYANQSQSSSSEGQLENMVKDLTKTVQVLTKEVATLKDSKESRRKIAGESTSSDWDALTMENMSEA